MTARTLRPWPGLILAAAAFLASSRSGTAHAQFGIGVAYPGVPFLYYNPQQAPSPTDYLYDRERARISELSNAAQQQAAASRMAAGDDSNAYYNRLRDYSGESTYHVGSRRSVAERASTIQGGPPQPPAERPGQARQGTLPLDRFFLAGGQFDWPRDATDAVDLRSARAEAEAALRAVRDELKSRGKARARAVGLAKSKLVGYGQRALAGVRSSRSVAVAEVFHQFLLNLYQSLDQAAEAGGP